MRSSMWLTAALASLGLGVLVVTPTAADRLPEKSDCIATFGHSVLPSGALLGEARSVSVHFSAVCAGRSAATHVVLAIGGPETLTLDERRDAHDAAQEIAQHLIADDTGLRIGVAGQHGAFSCNVSRELGAVLRCLDRAFDPRGSQQRHPPQDVLPAAAAILRRAGMQQAELDRRNTRQVVIVISSSPPADECAAWLRQSESVRESGILEATLCAGRSCNSRCLERVATSPRYAFELRDYSHLFDIFLRIRGLRDRESGSLAPSDLAVMDAPDDDYIYNTIRSLALDYPLPAGVAYVPDSLAPLSNWRSPSVHSEGSYDPATRRIVWRTNDVPKQGVTATFEVKPIAAGQIEMGTGATFSAVDSYGLSLDVDLAPQDISTFGSP